MGFLRDEHQRQEWIGVPSVYRTERKANRDPAVASLIRCQGSCARSHELLQSVQVDRAVAEAEGRQGKGTGRVLPEPAGSTQARWDVRVHPLRVLHDLMPVVLVEPRVLPWTRRAHAGVS